jgi:hypothetical protein
MAAGQARQIKNPTKQSHSAGLPDILFITLGLSRFIQTSCKAGNLEPAMSHRKKFTGMRRGTRWLSRAIRRSLYVMRS